jgi:uncharacterized protein (DUF2249 family)
LPSIAAAFKRPTPPLTFFCSQFRLRSIQLAGRHPKIFAAQSILTLGNFSDLIASRSVQYPEQRYLHTQQYQWKIPDPASRISKAS